jgi:predicted phosphodiesterase
VIGIITLILDVICRPAPVLERIAQMRIAAISDVHANLPALECVLDDLGRRSVDLIVDLGDKVSGPLWPRETADLLMRSRIVHIAGNHERQVLTSSPGEKGFVDSFACQSLTPDQLDWLSTLPGTLEPFEDVLCVHGTPRSDLEYLLASVEPTGARQATSEEIEQRVAGWSGSLLLCGHTHLARHVVMPSGLTIVNPGSVGWQAYDDDQPHPHLMESGSPHARYAIVEKTVSGWAVELVLVDYDWDLAAKQAVENGRADIARAIRTGRV